ncbi:FAD-dependent monooxygenase [Actinomadura sp. ATCC 31491]|uniref:FAD-dependent monooxygenase n=1 Tax=Actinomadura luzonensis TaxID=2805427 RepID=A0ABT0G900_9ACTN|nr:FAD-dependent monooxygenase [Actinomadura luzonensis]MCK2221075.1 FAD-dependent monooxygenase [Actinomadura luzonensis]
MLVAGGGIVGLSAALFLRRHGVRVLLVERHEGASLLPRGRILHSRAMELYRAHGLEEDIRRAPASVFRDFPELARAETLAGPETLRGARRPPDSSRGVSPCEPVLIDQSTLEPIVRAAAEAAGARVRFGTAMRSFTAGPGGVTAELSDGTSVRARFLVAADGHRSPVRERLGIAFPGRTLRHLATIAFEADLGRALRGRRLALCYLGSPAPGTLLALLDRRDRWVLMVPYDPGRGEGAASFTEERCLRMVRAAVGLDDLAARVLPAVPGDPAPVHTWEMSVRVAERYGAGPVFLAGDAAHVMPPAGGFGANTGIHDAHNLAWKLALVLRGRAGTELLASYEHERRPVALLTCEQAALRHEARAGTDGTGGVLLDPLEVDLGYSYRSEALVDRPAGRAPHLELTGDRRSVLDVLGPGFTLLAGADGDGGRAWAEAARRAGDRLGLPVGFWCAGADSAAWSRAYGVSTGGAALVRPDGFLAWRSPGRPAGDPAELVEACITRVLHQGRGRPAKHLI